MSEEPKKIIVDDDWKQQAQQEKAKLQQDTPAPDRQMPPAEFVVLVNSFAMQAMMMMGVIANPMTGKPEKDLDAARHYIDLLTMLEGKTKGNLTQEETDVLSLTLHDLRMAFVQVSKN
ncbi:MAG: DUF1844 domain-containing protein [Sedimentisphaerales bacterium]|nr:DUF1844 domain-containing protein [Sedimentisphaerales bacterium]